MGKLRRQVRPAAERTKEAYPYGVQVAGGMLSIFPSLKAAKESLRKQIVDFDVVMSRFGETGAEGVLAAIDAVPEDGGEVDEVLDPRTGLRFRVTVRKRS